MKSNRRTAILCAGLLTLLACGNEKKGAGPEGAPSGPVDPALAEQGHALFQSKGCVACHTIGKGRLVGPDLSGVTNRRSYAFVVGMVTNPDSMLANDTTAKRLLATYLTPMSNQGVSREEARGIFEFFRSNDRGTADDEASDEEEGDGS